MHKISLKRGLLIFVVLVALLANACSGGGAPAPSQRPVLYNIGIDLDDFNFEDLRADNRNPYIAFGAPFREGTLNATFEYYLNAGGGIVSPVSGTVLEVEYKDPPGDYSISIEATDAPDWQIILDHVQNPTVEAGDAVEAGQSLGVAGVWEKSFGRTELQIFNNNDYLSYCPMAFIAPEIDTQLSEELLDLMENWMNYIEDHTVYDVDEMDPMGCLAETVQG